MSEKKSDKLLQPPITGDLIPVGPRHLQTRRRGKRDGNGLKPTTSRALVLRNGKYGARGMGEVVLVRKMTGREKLDLLAEDLISQISRTALMAPLDLGKCIRIADSQYNAYLDDIAHLKDPDTFYYKIVTELIARMQRGTQGGQQHLRNPSHVASVISTRVHNAYMVASGWRLVVDILRSLQNSGLNDATARAQLQTDDDLRTQYLVLCDIVSVLVDLGQAHFSILAMTSPHYSRYFKEVENMDPGEPCIAFDWASLKDACKSFLDSIIIELCFPRAPYPKRILYQILHDAVDESPKEAMRFPQSMWDAVGDLSVSLELQELLESALLGSQGNKLRVLPHQMPEKYERWLDAQIYSKKASESYANFKDLVSPLEKTKDLSVLNNMWSLIDLNYKAISGLSLDSLWQLDELHRTPQWTSFYTPSLRHYDSDSDNEPFSKPLLKGGSQKRAGRKKKQKKPLAIADSVDDNGNESMPGLQSVSDSSGGDGDGISHSENDEEEESDYDEETNYDSEEEEACRTMLREAMDTAMEIPEFFDPKSTIPEFVALADVKRENPFLKLLGSLRGRMFSSDPKLSSTTRTEPRRCLFEQKRKPVETTLGQTVVSARGPTVSDVFSRIPSQTPTTPTKKHFPVSTSEESKDHRATVEDAEGEEDASSITSKKKKPKKKRKKREVGTELPTVHEDSVPPVSATFKNLPSSTVTSTPIKAPEKKPLASNASPSSTAHPSNTSLPVEPMHAQSAHSYLQGLGSSKGKVKTRPDHPSISADKKGFLPKFASKEKTKKENESDPPLNKKFTWFTKLGKKTTGYMQQLLRINAEEKAGTMKWDNFVKVMRDIGFKYNPSTAGSSVRFDPPNPNDRSISFHKPHPDSTLHAHKLREFGNKLKEYYGWSEEDFLRRTGTI